MSIGTRDSSNSLALCPRSFQKFCQFITRELGIKMSDAKLPMLQSRLQRRLRELQLGSLEEYQQHLFACPEDGEERVHFINAITTNKTDFFREPQHFDYLLRTALPKLDPSRPAVDSPALKQYHEALRSEEGGGRPEDGGLRAEGRLGGPWKVKVWCAGCSSGEEAYTLAMVLSEFGAKRPGFDFELLATDISTKVLEHARMGIYDNERVDPVPAMWRPKYLLRSKDPARKQVRIVPALRQKIQFQRLNFMDDEYPVRDVFDLIFFRNVMIYFSKPTQEAVINKLCRHLAHGGYLFAGHSESLAGLKIPVQCIGAAIYRKPPGSP